MSDQLVNREGSIMSRRMALTTLPAAAGVAAMPVCAYARDPILDLFADWKSARRELRRTAELPGNENLDSPEFMAALDREKAAEMAMLETRPTTFEGIAAMATVAWEVMLPCFTDPEDVAASMTYENRLVAAIWRGATGRDGYPVES